MLANVGKKTVVKRMVEKSENSRFMCVVLNSYAKRFCMQNHVVYSVEFPEPVVQPLKAHLGWSGVGERNEYRRPKAYEVCC